MRDIQSISAALFQKIRARFPRVSLGDENAKATMDPAQAKFINFDFELDGQNIGNITISLADQNSLKVYYGSNVTKNINSQNKGQWYNFLKDLRQFAKMNMLSFDPRDIGKGSLQLNDIKNVSMIDNEAYQVRESKDVSPLTGSSKTSSQMFGPVKILVKHKNKVDENIRGSRARNVESIYLENAEGERFKLPFTKLGGARAMARHLSNGGQVYDDFGKHIVEMVQEMKDLSYFVRSSKHANESLLEDEETKSIIETATQHYYNLKRKLSGLQGQRGYHKFKEDGQGTAGQAMNAPNVPADSTSPMGGITPDYESYATTLKEKFTQKVLDSRFDAAWPHIAKVYANKKHHDSVTESCIREWMKAPKIGSGDVKMKKMTEIFNTKMEGQESGPNDLASKVFEFIDLHEDSQEIKTYSGVAKKWMNESSKDKKVLALEFATSYMRNLKTKTNPLQEYIKSLNNILRESTWIKPENEVKIRELQKILSKPLPFGIDGNNASSALYNILGDDELFDAFYHDSKTMGAKADARKTIEWFIRHNLPELLDQLDFSGENKDMSKVPDREETPEPDEEGEEEGDNEAGGEDTVNDIKKLAGI